MLLHAWAAPYIVGAGASQPEGPGLETWLDRPKLFLCGVLSKMMMISRLDLVLSNMTRLNLNISAQA